MKALTMRQIITLLMLGSLTMSVACRTAAPAGEQEIPVAEAPGSSAAAQQPSTEDEQALPELPEVVDSPGGEAQEPEEIAEQVAPHVDARIKAAISRADAGDGEAAMQTLSDLVDEPEGGFLAAYNLGVLHDRAGDGAEAARRYVEALRRQPDFTPALTNLLRVYLRSGEVTEAQTLAQRYVDARPGNLDHQAARLEVWLAQGRYDDVVQGARDILRRDVRHVEAMYQMATARYELGQFELAAAILQRALQLSPERGDFYFLLAMISLSLDQVDGARANLRRAIELQPRFPEARNRYGVMLHESGNYDRAIEQLEAAVEDAPDYDEALVNLGNSYKATGEFELAEASFRDAIEINANNADAYFNLGILYLEAPVPGYEDIDRLEKSVEAFVAYRQIVGPRRASEGPVAAYLEEANSAIEREQARQEMLRRAQMDSQNDSDPGRDDESQNQGESDDE